MGLEHKVFCICYGPPQAWLSMSLLFSHAILQNVMVTECASCKSARKDCMLTGSACIRRQFSQTTTKASEYKDTDYSSCLIIETFVWHTGITLEFTCGFYKLSHIWFSQQPEVDNTGAIHSMKWASTIQYRKAFDEGKRVPPEGMHGKDLSEDISNTQYAHSWRLSPDYVNTNLRVKWHQPFQLQWGMCFHRWDFSLQKRGKHDLPLCSKSIQPHSPSPAFQVQWVDWLLK